MKSKNSPKASSFAGKALILCVVSLLLLVGGVLSIAHEQQHFSSHDDGCVLCQGFANSNHLGTAPTLIIPVKTAVLVDQLLNSTESVALTLDLALALRSRGPPAGF